MGTAVNGRCVRLHALNGESTSGVKRSSQLTTSSADIGRASTTTAWLCDAPLVFHHKIASPPEKSLPADNLPAKIRPAQRSPRRDGFLPVFSGGDPFNGDTFYGAGDILITGDI